MIINKTARLIWCNRLELLHLEDSSIQMDSTMLLLKTKASNISPAPHLIKRKAVNQKEDELNKHNINNK